MQFIVICALVALFVAPALGLALPPAVLNVAGVILVVGIAFVANGTVNKVKGGKLRETAKELGMGARDIRAALNEVTDGFKDAAKTDGDTKNKA